MSGVGGGGARGASAPQKVLLCQKYGQNQCKSGKKHRNLGKICENLHKFPGKSG